MLTQKRNNRLTDDWGTDALMVGLGLGLKVGRDTKYSERLDEGVSFGVFGHFQGHMHEADDDKDTDTDDTDARISSEGI